MKKNFKTVLCVTALLSAMSVLPAYSEDITIDIPEIYSDSNPLVVDGDLKIESGVIIENHSNNNQATIDVSGKLVNLCKIEGDNGILHVQNGGNNSGYIYQNIIEFTQGTFENNGTILADYIRSGADITGTGKLGIRAGEFAGNVTQENLTFTGNGERRIRIDKNLEIDTISGNGTILLLSDNACVKANKNGSDTTKISFISSGKSTSLDAGNITIGDLDIRGGSLKFISGNVETSSKVYIWDNATLEVSKGDNGKASLVMGSGDTWNGILKLTGGDLDISEYGKNKTLIAESGSLVAKDLEIGTGSEILKDTDVTAETISVITGGNVAIDDKDSISTSVSLDGGKLDHYVTSNPSYKFSATSGDLNLENGSKLTVNGNDHTIANDINLNIKSGAELTIDGENLALSNGDTWAGDVILSSGSLTTDITSNGKLNATGGNLNIVGGTLTIANGSSIAGAVNTTINDNVTLNITGGDVTFDRADSSRGTISLNGGSLTLDNDLEYGKLEANSGKLNIVSTTLNNGNYVKNDVELNAKDGLINIENGELSVNNGDDITGATINITNENGTFNYGIENNQEFQLGVSDANVNILENANLTLKNGSSVGGKLDLQKNATLTMQNGTSLTIGNTSSWDGTIKNDGGRITVDNFVNTSPTSSFVQNSGSTDINNSNITFNQNSAIKGGDVYIFDSALNLVKSDVTGGNISLVGNSNFNYTGGNFNIDKLNASNGTENILINTMNGEINSSTIGSMDIKNQANFYIDIIGTETDQFKISSLSDDNKLFIKDWALSGEVPSQSSIQLGSIFTDNDGNPLLGDNISVTDKTVSNPIGKYRLNRNSLAGTYSIDLTGYNSQVFRGQVATIAQWQNQLAIDDMLFTHSMVLPSFKEENSKYANKYAATDPLFAPYQYSNKDGGLWYKAYGTFEHLQMNQGLDVGNNSYGALVGADFRMKELKKGWRFMPTAYLGYNGAHQYFSGVSQYQNGGQMGFMGTWYKDNFIVSSLTYGGVYDNQMDVAGHSENSFNYFAGTAAKAAYNWKLHKDLSLQPNLMVAYNYFGQQNWHSDYGQIGMMAGMMHGVNIAPGVNLIWEKETFSTYLTLQYMYNVNGAVNGNAGNVDLPNVEMERGYIQYGIGATKKLTDRCSGYFQAVLRNVGRTGAGFQAGFSIKLGKKNK